MPLTAVFELQALRLSASGYEAAALQLATLRSNLNQAAANVGWDLALHATPAAVESEMSVLRSRVDSGIAVLEADPVDGAAVAAIATSSRALMTTLTATVDGTALGDTATLLQLHARSVSLVDQYAATLSARETTSESMFGFSVWTLVLAESAVLAGALWYGLAWRRRTAVEHARQESLARLAAVVDNAPVVAYAIDADGVLRFLQGRSLEQLGIDPQKLVGRSITQIFGDDDGVLSAHRRVLSGERLHVQLDLLGRTWDIRGSLLQPPGADRAEVVGVAHDVTGLVVSQEEVRRSEERFRALVQNSSDLISVIGPDGKVSYVSAAVGDYGAGSPETQLGAGLEVVLEEDRPRVSALMNDLLNQPGGVIRTRYRFPHPDGTVHWAESVGRNALDNPAVGGIVVNTRDITNLVRSHEELEQTGCELRAAHRRSEEALTLLEALQASAPVGFAFVDLEYRFVRVNDTLAAINGKPASELIGHTVAETVPAVWPQLERTYHNVIATGEAVSNVEIEWEVASDPGRVHHSLNSYYPVKVDGEVVGLGIVLVDMTDRLAAEAALAQANELLATQARILTMIESGATLRDTLTAITAEVKDQMPDVRSTIQLLGVDGSLEISAAVSRDMLACAHMEGRPADDESICGRALLRDKPMLVDDPAASAQWASQPCLTGSTDVQKCWVTPIRRDPNGEPVGVFSCYFTSSYEPDDRARQVVQTACELAAVAIDRKRFEDQLSHQSLHDQLTGLPNRALLVEQLRGDVARSARTASIGAILFIDLDRFKMVNDSLGHESGDHVLREVARRIVAEVRAEDTVARLAGDEFVVSCPDIRDDQESIRLAQRLLRAINQPFKVRSQELRLTASIGIALRHPGDTRVETLLRNGDVALYRAKDRGRDRWEMFDESLRKRAVQRLRTETALRKAVETGDFEVWYQPVWSVARRQVASVEALVRWPQPRGQMASPATFIPLAEETGLISKLGAWVLGQACADGARLDGERVVVPRIAVNASARQLTDGSLLPAVEAALTAARWDPRRLTVEVTESAIILDPAAALRTLEALRNLGVTIALDDFGTGFSSMSYLKDLRYVDVIKIDRSFVCGLEDCSSTDHAIVRATIALAEAIGARVIAEGVETTGQLQTLVSLGCDLMQGFLVARPMPVTELLEAMREQPWRATLQDAVPALPSLRLAAE